MSWYLWIVGVAFLLGSALPLLVVPLKWGKAFGWQIPDESAYAVYLGRCLGGVAIVLSILACRAAPQPTEHIESLQVLLGAASMLTVVHIWGAIRREQPWQETAEVGMYLILVGVGAYLYSGLP